MNNINNEHYTVENYEEFLYSQFEDLPGEEYDGIRSTACSATALASTLGMYYNDTSYTPAMIVDNYWENGQLSGWTSFVDSEVFISDAEEYLDCIKYQMALGKPVIVCVQGTGTTHYVTVIGYVGNDLADASFDDLIIIESAAGTKTTMKNEEKTNTLYEWNSSNNSGNGWRVGYRFVVPYRYSINSNGDIIIKGSENMKIRYSTSDIRKMIDSINSQNLPDGEKKRLIEQMMSICLANNNNYVLTNVIINENGEYKAADEGADGFDTVTVNVADRYEEGYDIGKGEGWSLAQEYYGGTSGGIGKDFYVCFYTVDYPNIFPPLRYVMCRIYKIKDGNYERIHSSMYWMHGSTNYSYYTEIVSIKASGGKFTIYTKSYDINGNVYDYEKYYDLSSYGVGIGNNYTLGREDPVEN